jgi:hypothetical protein
LLIVGQQEEMVLGMLANGVIALRGQMPADTAAESRGFFVLDGSRPDSPDSGFWRQLNRQATLDATVVTPRDAASAVHKIAAEVDRRVTAGEPTAPPIFLIVYNLARFRDLKKSEEFGGFDDDDIANATKQLAAILREGPAVGVHTLLWSDSFSNLNRWVDRQSMRDLELRVLFQMSATDSSNLMDSPAASRLGGHMAICYSEERGQAEKFRPYGLPSQDWLAWVESHLANRTSAPDNVDAAATKS